MTSRTMDTTHDCCSDCCASDCFGLLRIAFRITVPNKKLILCYGYIGDETKTCEPADRSRCGGGLGEYGTLGSALTSTDLRWAGPTRAAWEGLNATACARHATGRATTAWRDAIVRSLHHKVLFDHSPVPVLRCCYRPLLEKECQHMALQAHSLCREHICGCPQAFL